MTPEQIKELIDQPTKVGEFLATEAYRLIGQQVYADIASASIWLAVQVVFFIVALRFCVKSWMSRYKDNRINEIGRSFGTFVVIVLMDFITVNISNTAPKIIQKLLNLF